MSNSALTWPASNDNKYYNPVSRIRSLIKNLDAELMELCDQCKKTKSTEVVVKKSVSTTKSRLPFVTKIPNNLKPFIVKQPNSKPESLNKMNSTIQTGTSIVQFKTDNAAASPSKELKPSLSLRQLANMYRSKVIDAYRNRRIFTVYGNYHTIRRALLQRGWLEKLAPSRFAKLQTLSEDVLLQHAKKGNEFEAVVISRIINHFPPFFIWQPKGFRDNNNEVRPYRNRIRRGAGLDFSTKIGLIGCAELEDWYSQEGISRLSHPRFYRLNASAEERMAFIDDFRHTQCLCLLRYLAKHINTIDKVNDELNGTIMSTIITFAIAQVKRQLKNIDCCLNDTDVNSSALDAKKDDESAEWDSFMSSSYLVLRNRSKFKCNVREISEYARVARGLIDQVEKKYPDYKWDGERNLWILKPGYQSRGIGIIIRSSLDDILQWTAANYNRKYVAQKYIERPLLVYKTKFDIRQYMLLTIGPLNVTIWLYTDCYLRFSSQEYSIDDLRESIHLTNNSVQKRYRNKQSRDARLPKHNMWSLEQFKDYLKDLKGKNTDIWQKIIYPGITQNMIAVVQASLEETDFVENAFELYGCDFMLDEEFNPILIEINATPDLTPSTEVTARICPNVLRDAIRVIVDLPKNFKAPTGQFEKVFEVNYKIERNVEKNAGINVTGTKMTLFQPLPTFYRPRFWRRATKTPRPEISTKHIRRQNVSGRKKIAVSLVMSKPRAVPPESSDTLAQLSAADKQALALQYTQPV